MVIMDLVLQANLSRHALRDTLMAALGDAGRAWAMYRSVLLWWSFRVPVAYLVTGSALNVVAQLLPNGSTSSFVFSVAFSFMLIMAAAAAMRLLPLRSKELPPADWINAEAAYRGE